MIESGLILNWVDAQANLPSRARWIAKADVALNRATNRAMRRPSYYRRVFLFPDSDIPRETIQAYLETYYHVAGDAPTQLQVGQFNPTLSALHDAHQVASSAFITACNPFSQDLGAEANAARQATLAHELEQLGLRYIDGIGQHASNGWPGEASFLVLGSTLDIAKSLGEKHGQNAIIWCASNAVPQLILLR